MNSFYSKYVNLPLNASVQSMLSYCLRCLYGGGSGGRGAFRP